MYNLLFRTGTSWWLVVLPLWIFIEFFCAIKLSQPSLMRSKNVQCCGSGMVIQDPNPDLGSEIFPDPHPDLSKTLSSRKYDSKSSSRIRILIFYPSRDLGSRGSKSHRILDPDPQYWALINFFSPQIHRDWPLASWEDGAPCRTAGSLPAPHQVRDTDMLLPAFRILWIRIYLSSGFLPNTFLYQRFKEISDSDLL